MEANQFSHVWKPFLNLILSTTRPCLIRCNVPLETTLLDPRELLCTLCGHRWIQRPYLQIESMKGNDIKSFNTTLLCFTEICLT